MAVNPGVQETEVRLSRSFAVIINHRDDGREHGSRGRSAANGDLAAVINDAEILALGRDVWKTAARNIKKTTPRRTKMISKIRLHSRVLVGGAWEELAEAARGEVDCLFGFDTSRAADGGYVGAGGGEDGDEFCCVSAVVAEAAGTDACVAAGEEDADTADAELADGIAYFAGIRGRYTLFRFAIGGRQDVGKFRVREAVEVGKVFEVRLVLVICFIRLVKIWHKWATAGRAVVINLNRWGNKT